MDPNFARMVREQVAGYRVANELQLEEKRQRTPQERLRLAQVFLNRLADMDRLPVNHDKEIYHSKWQLLREKWLERYAES
jgi:predicted nucleic acid-binding protein